MGTDLGFFATRKGRKCDFYNKVNAKLFYIPIGNLT